MKSVHTTEFALTSLLTLLHLADELLVEEATGLLVEWAVDGHNIALCQHILQSVDSAATNLLLNLWGKWLVVVVQQLLAVERLQSAQHTLTNTSDGNGADSLALQVVLVLGNRGNVPFTGSNLLVGRDEVAYKDEHGHDDMLRDRHNVGSSDLGNSDTAIGLVGSVQVDVVRTDTSRDSKLQVLGLGQALSSQITGVETAQRSIRASWHRGTSSYGVVMMTSASTSSWSNLLFSPSLSEVVTRV